MRRGKGKRERKGQLTNRHIIPLILALGQREKGPEVIANHPPGRQLKSDPFPLGPVPFLFPQQQPIQLRTSNAELAVPTN